MRRIAFAALLAAPMGLVAAIQSAGESAAQSASVEVSISCGAVGIELELCKAASERWAEKTGHSVTVISTPNSSTERLALYQQILAAGASDIDVFQVDVVWPGILGTHFIDLAPHADGAEAAHFEAIITNNTIDGALKAMPLYTDAGVLYYRADLLEKHAQPVPTTWEELGAVARRVMANERAAGADRMWGYVFQGRAYEGLTCNALEWIDAHGGGTIVDGAGEITIANDAAVAALETVAGFMADIVPPGALNYAEEESRGVFQSGNAVFMRNWPYAWALAQSEDSPVRGKVGVAALPKGGADGQNTGTLGGWNLAVSRYSEHPEIAADLVMHLVGAEEQKIRAIEGSYNPAIRALYQDPEILEAVPFFGDLFATFENAVARPSGVTGENYNRVSAAFWESVHDVLSGDASAADAMAALEDDLARIRRRGW
ncbi:MAG: ABC transporter substrate-binding protein [Pseudomonadota bacterium]